jgi:hypothetical protein
VAVAGHLQRVTGQPSAGGRNLDRPRALLFLARPGHVVGYGVPARMLSPPARRDVPRPASGARRHQRVGGSAGHATDRLSWGRPGSTGRRRAARYQARTPAASTPTWIVGRRGRWPRCGARCARARPARSNAHRGSS